VSLARRVANIEQVLTPVQLVLRWLDEAYAFGSLAAYSDSVLASAPSAMPLDRLCREADRSARARVASRDQEQIRRAVNGALVATVMRFELVMRINVLALEVLDRQVLLNALISAQTAVLLSEERRSRRADPIHQRRFGLVRDMARLRVAELAAGDEARRQAERRYLEGHPALFPETLAASSEALVEAARLAAFVTQAAELDGVAPIEPADPPIDEGRVAQLVADFVEPSRSNAYDKLGSGERAITIAAEWLTAKHEGEMAVVEPSP
jgi:hypothetical protein